MWLQRTENRYPWMMTAFPVIGQIDQLWINNRNYKNTLSRERGSDLRDRELIEVSLNQINEINRQSIHARLEIIVRPKGQIGGDN
jgi:hypothetical protein